MGDESWSERQQAAGAETEGAAATPARGEGDAARPAEVLGRTAPHFAVAGQVIGRRRTVFAAVPVAAIKPNPLQPRQHFDDASIDELAQSIRARGLLQPIIVRRDADGGYTLVAGERRLRAAERAGVGLVPAILSDDDLLEVALEENVQREDLSPLEEAEALAALAAERGLTHADLAEKIHKSRPYVSNTLTLTRLPPDIKQEYFADGAVVSREILISIARQEDPEKMRALWRRVRMEALSVRTFREREKEAKKPSPTAEVLRAARKLNRILQSLPDPLALPEQEARTLQRALRRTSRNVARVLAALSGDASAGASAAEDRSAQPTPLRRVAAAGEAPSIGRVAFASHPGRFRGSF